MTALRHRRREDLPRRGLVPRTQPCDIEAVQHLAPHYRRAPDQLNAEESRQDVRYVLPEQQGAASPCRIPREGIRLFYAITRQRPWPVLTRMRPRPRPTLPVVWSPREVRARLASVVNPNAAMGRRMS
jgi:hypothetical protein